MRPMERKTPFATLMVNCCTMRHLIIPLTRSLTRLTRMSSWLTVVSLAEELPQNLCLFMTYSSHCFRWRTCPKFCYGLTLNYAQHVKGAPQVEKLLSFLVFRYSWKGWSLALDGLYGAQNQLGSVYRLIILGVWFLISDSRSYCLHWRLVQIRI